jgi:hypothetical protein
MPSSLASLSPRVGGHGVIATWSQPWEMQQASRSFTTIDDSTDRKEPTVQATEDSASHHIASIGEDSTSEATVVRDSLIVAADTIISDGSDAGLATVVQDTPVASAHDIVSDGCDSNQDAAVEDIVSDGGDSNQDAAVQEIVSDGGDSNQEAAVQDTPKEVSPSDDGDSSQSAIVAQDTPKAGSITTPPEPRPRASNPFRFQKPFVDVAFSPPPALKEEAPVKKRSPRPKPQKLITWGEHFTTSGERVSITPWVRISDISPLSSLEAMVEGMGRALEEEMADKGIMNLDALYTPGGTPPNLTIEAATGGENRSSSDPYVLEAKLILSPFARPTGWYVRLRNRSLAEAMIRRDKAGKPLVCATRRVKVKQYNLPKKRETQFEGHLPVLSDAMIRVENCPEDLTKVALLNFFSRFDLSLSKEHESIIPWAGITPEGRQASHPTFLVHFADASWARAALRERQGAKMSGQTVRLVQFPRQL